MPTGYCTVDDLRRALKAANLPGDVSQDREIAIKAITSQTDWLERTTARHWYVPERPEEDADDELLPTTTQTRDDEHDIPTGGVHMVGEPAEPKTWQGSYTKLRLERKDVQQVTTLLVRGEDGYEDWVESDDYDGGSWPDALGDDYYLRINNKGWTELYLDVDNLYDETEDEFVLESFANAVYVEIEYGHEGIPDAIRQAVAMRAAAQLLNDDETELGIPDEGGLVNPETKIQTLERQAEELLENHVA